MARSRSYRFGACPGPCATDSADLFEGCACGDGTKWEALLRADYSQLAENREWGSAHEALFVQRVLKCHQARRLASGRFMYQPPEEDDAGEFEVFGA